MNRGGGGGGAWLLAKEFKTTSPTTFEDKTTHTPSNTQRKKSTYMGHGTDGCHPQGHVQAVQHLSAA